MDVDIPACASCKISFIASDSVSAAICGHLFHETCVNRITCGNTKKCPECQVGCQESQLLRIYLPFLHETSTPESLVSNHKIVNHELKAVKKEYVQDQSHLDSLIGTATRIMHTKHEKLAELKALNKEKERLQKKIKELEKIQMVQKACFGTRMDVEKVLDQKLSADTLATMVVVLKRETRLAEAEKTDLRLNMRQEQKENKILTAKYRSLRTKHEVAIARSINRGRQN